MSTADHSPAYKIFHYKFNYTIPGIHYYSQEYLDTVGLVSTGNVKEDKELLKRPVNTRGTIMEIAEHFFYDHQVAIVNTRDSVAMYEIVRDHLQNWRQALGSESNVPDAPLDQLRMLDEFATSIFEMARRYKPDVKQKQSISTRMRQLGGSSSLRKGITSSTPSTAKPKEIPVHHPVIDAIENYYAKRNE